MPSYPFLARPLQVDNIDQHLKTLRIVGVPYTDDMIANAKADLAAQATPDADTKGLLARYPKAVVGDFDGNPAQVSELDALIAYLQVLGTMVDFTTYKPQYAANPESQP